MYSIFISEYQVERGEERSTMMRVMGQSQVLETNNMLISIYFITKGDFGDYGGEDYGGFDDGGGFDGGDRWTS